MRQLPTQLILLEWKRSAFLHEEASSGGCSSGLDDAFDCFDGFDGFGDATAGYDEYR